jgi:hypothetical protein
VDRPVNELANGTAKELVSGLAAQMRYGGRLMASWVHLAGLACMGLVLVSEIPMGIGAREAALVGAGAQSLGGGRGAAWLGLRMIEVFLPALAPAITASVLAPEQAHGGAELAAARPGSLRRVVAGRFIVILAALAAVTAAGIAWVTRALGGQLTAWALVKAAVPTIWVLSCATVLGSVLGGVLGGFGAGFGWWALDLMTSGSITRRLHLFLFGVTHCNT